MTTTPNEDTNAAEDPIFDPFPKPVTIPSGWDLSEITPNPEPVSEETET
ncbi:hypothetical protein ACFL1A_02735 [Patescibacteria group bacterium]